MRLRAILLLGTGLAAPLFSQEVRLEWAAHAGFDAYIPQHVPLTPARPSSIRRLPSGVTNPVYGQIVVGPREARATYTILIDERADGDHRLWIDADGDGDLTGDPPVAWKRVTRPGASSTYSGSATLRVAYGGKVLPLELALYRLAKPFHGDTTPSLFCYRQWGYKGEVRLGDKAYRAMLDDQLSTGDFRGGDADAARGSGVFLLLDLNGDGRFFPNERFDVRKPFNIGGTTYEVAGLDASGAGLRIVTSSQSVAETKPGAVLQAGTPSVPFEGQTASGAKMRFPEDVKARLVLLDFWATWCGPCRSELPNLKGVYDTYHARGFDVVGVSLDTANGLEKLRNFTAENGLPWPQVWDGKGWDSDVVKAYNVHAIPDGYLVDLATRKIVASGTNVRGALLRSAVEKALGTVATAIAARAAPPRPSPAANPVRALPGGPVQTNTIVLGSRRVPVASPDPPTDGLLSRAESAAAAGRLLASAPLLERRRSPSRLPLTLAEPSTKELSGRALARLARAAYLRAGWYYRCTKCGQRHVKLAGAYAVSRDTVVTAWHVMTPPDTGTSAVALVVDAADNILSVTDVVAGDERTDVIALRVSGTSLVPLALNPAAEAGDAAYCFSDPLKQRGYFSAGIVNRIYGASDAPRMDVSTDWGPGSSGAAILDASGNVIGHVARIRPLFDEHHDAAPNESAHDGDAANGTPLLTLHIAVPAKSVLALLRP